MNTYPSSNRIKTITEVKNMKCKISDKITLKANVTDIKYNPLTEGNVSFYKKDNLLGRSPVIDGTAIIYLKFDKESEFEIESVYTSSDKYCKSSTTSKIEVSKLNIKLSIPSIKISEKDTIINTEIKDENDNLVTHGLIDYYINNEYIGSVNVQNGKATYYTENRKITKLLAVYNDFDQYNKNEIVISK